MQILLENGANPYIKDRNGNDPFTCACMFNRLENVKFWLQYFPNWNLESLGKYGGTAFGSAVYMGPNRFEIVKYLLEKGANERVVTFNGTTTLMMACMNEYVFSLNRILISIYFYFQPRPHPPTHTEIQIYALYVCY